MNRYSLIPHLNKITSANFRSQTIPTRKNFLAWQKTKRRVLARLLSVDKLTIKKIVKKSEKKKANFVISLFDFYLNDGTVMPVYMGHAKEVVAPFKSLLIYHGHANGAQTVFGYSLTKEHQDYAIEFMKKGYLVVAPDQRGFGDRLASSPIHYNGYTRSCRQLAFDLLLNGKTLLGERVSEAVCLVDYLKNRPDVMKDKIVVTGNSGGGTTAMLHAALDERVAGVIVGSAFCEYRHSIMELSHCECNYLPNLLNNFQEIWQVAALIAPRPLLVVHGRHDKIFPVKYTRSAFRNLQDYYALCATGKGKLQLAIHSGSHHYDHGQVFKFLEGN
jgi:dienelactone hydrolase